MAQPIKEYSTEIWTLKNGKKHREGGPAVIRYDSERKRKSQRGMLV